MATCADDQSGPTRGGTGYFAFRPVYGISGTLSQFGIVADSVHIRLTRPVDQTVLDTVVFFPADSSQLRLALPVILESSPETLTAVIGISSGPTMLFTDSLDVSVVDGPPSVANIPTVLLTYVGPGKNVAAITLAPGDTTIVLGDTLFFSATAIDSSAAAVASFFVGWKTSDTNVARINGAGRLIAPNLRGTVKVIGTTPTGIADTTTVVFAPVPTQILADSGDLQSGIVADSLGGLFVAKVIAADLQGISGIAVRWTAVKPGGVVRDTLLFTDAQGRVKTRGVLGDSVATYTYTATVVGTAITRSFSATATAAAPSAIASISGDLQSDSAGRVLAAPFTVRVTDAFGNPVSGAKVYWTRVFGSGTVAADSTLTNATGLASTGFTLGAVGSDSINAALAGTSAFVQFSATAINGLPATATKVFGDTQTAAVGQLLTDSLAVVVKSATNFPVVGAPVVWSVLRGGATSADTAFTDVNGRAAVAYTLGTLAGSDSVRAQAGAVAAVFTATAQAAAPTAIAIVSGNAQVDTANRALPLPLVVAVTDAFGNAVLGAPVTFTRVAGHGHVGSDTVTSVADNRPASTYTFGSIPGTDSIRVTLLANGASVTFAESSINATPASVIEIHGNGIGTLVGTPFSDSLIVQILDNNDDPIALQQVIWTVTSGTGTVALDTVLTDSLGFAVQHVTAGGTAGTLVVNAKVVTPISPVNFALNLNAGAATSIALVSGDAQTDTTGKILPLPLQVHVTDALGNPIAGAQVAWATVAGAGHPNNDTTLTDISGNSQVAYTLGAAATTDSVKASLVGTSAFVHFTETGVSAAPAGILKLLGDAQVDTVLSTLTDSLVVSLRDGGNNPIANTWLYWTQIPGGVTLSADSSLTDVNGRAAVRATFGAVATTFPVLVRNVDTTVATVFLLTAHPGVLTQITKILGDAQTGPVSTPLPIDFGVVVQDGHGNLALPGTAVTWTDLHGFTPAGLPDTTVTDSFGIAKLVQPLPGPVVGEDSLIAQILGGTAADTFTVTTTAGAASSLVYVSGTGQTDTVSALLAAPLIVQARDAASNPVPGVYVHFTRVSGTGVVLSDSALTDGAGAAQTQYSLGTLAGRDSIIATMAGSPDTVAFYNVATPGAPKSLAIVSGDSQAVAVSSALPAPFVVRIADQFGNPIQGPTVTFDTVGTGATIAGTPATTDAAGLATTGTVTLGASVGTFSFPATSASLPGDTVFFTAVALPIGTSKQWLGTLSANWGTAGNWNPAAIPSSADNVFIPAAAATQPVLDAARSVGGLQVESGASVTLNTFNLTMLGNVQVDGTVNRTSGLMVLSAAAGTAQGNLAGVRVTGNLTLSGTTSVADSLQLTGGSLVVGGHILTINGDFSNTGSGAFTMTDPADSVTVTKTTLYNGAATAGLLTAGTLVLDGPFTEPSGAAVFQASGTHTTVFAGGTNQGVTFAAATLAGNRFENVVFANPSGITLGGDLAATGTVTVSSGVVTGLGRTAFLGGDLLDPTSTGWNVATTSIAGTPTVLPDTILGNLDVTGTVNLAHGFVVKGNYTQSGGTFQPNAFPVRIEGTTALTGTAAFAMQSPGDSVDLVGAVTWNGTTTGGFLTGGTLVLRGDLSVPTGSSVFQASGTHKTVFAGAAAQQVNIGGAAVGTNYFNDLVVANPAGVQLQSNIATFGRATITAGTLTGAHTAFIGTGVADPTNVSWLPDLTEFTGSVTALPDSFGKGVTVSGGVALLKPLVVKGPVSVVNTGSFDLNGFTARFDSTLTVSGSAQFEMLNPADSLDVGGTVSWDGSTASGLLTAGRLVIRGNMSVPTGASVFQPNGSHLTIFAGTAPQTIDFGASTLAGNRFNAFTAANAAGVSLTSNLAFAGDVAVTAGSVTAVGHTAVVNGNLSDPTGVAWRPEITSLTGTPTVLPDSFARNVTVSGTVTLTHPVAFQASLTTTAGAFALNGFHVRVDSTLTVSGSAQLLMQNAADTLDVHELVTWNGSTATGLLTAGTLILRGGISEPSGSAVFQPSGTHTTLFAGGVSQTVTFAATGPAGNRFQNFVVNDVNGVHFAASANINGNATVITGPVTSNAGLAVTVGGDLSDTSNVSWRPENTTLSGTPTVLPDSFARNVSVSGTLTLAHPMAFRANLALTNGALTVNGNRVRVDSGFAVSGSAQFKMQAAADTFDVHGAFSIDGSTSTGLLTAGALILHGDFSEPSGSSVFQPSGTHITVFRDSVTHTVTFGATAPTGNRFNDLRLEGPTALALGNDLVVNGSLAAPMGLPVTIGSTAGLRLVSASGLTLNAVTFDSVRLSYSGGPISFLQKVTFQHQDPTTVQFAIAEAGSGTPEQMGKVQFLTTPTTGKYLSATDTLANGSPLTIQMYTSFPLDGTAFEQQGAGADGASIDWSTFKFLIQPLDNSVLGILDTVQVVLDGPDNNPDANFTDSVTLALGANPGSATLGGTTTVAAVQGVAKFGDLTLSAAGIGFDLVAATPGIAPDTSSAFNITIPLPVGFTMQWLGGTSTDWADPTNWSTGILPDSSSNVFISGVTLNAPVLLAGNDSVNKLRVATGGTLTLASGTTLTTRSDVEAFGSIAGAGTLLPAGTSTITGNVSTPATILGDISVAGTATFGFNLTVGGSIGGSLTVGPDTLAVTGLLQTVNDGLLNMTSGSALVDVTGPAQFSGGSSTLTGGTFRVSGDLSTGGEHSDAFAPTGSHVTVLNGSGLQTVAFQTADSQFGSHFGILQVSTAGTALMAGRYDALGDLTVTTGATLADSARAGFEAHGFTTVDAGGTLQLASLRTRGAIGVAVGATYAVGRTTYYGGSAFPINPAPYDTLALQLTGVASGDFVVGGDLLIEGFSGAAGFDLGGHTVTVNGGVRIDGNGTLTMQKPADALNVAGDFFTNGASTIGLLTAGTLQIGGNFRQAGDGSGSAFWASAGHLTRFTGGAGHRNITFDNRAFGAADSNDSKFGDLDLADGVDSLSQSGLLAETVSIGGSVEYDTTYGGDIMALGAVTLAAAADTIHLSQLATHVGITVVGTPAYRVTTTAFFGGSALPALAYQNVLIAGPTITLPGDLTIAGNLITGVYNEVGPDLGGDVVVNGHVLTVGGLYTKGQGVFTMAPGDSVDVRGDIYFDGGNTAGHLTGGTLVGRGNFAAGLTNGDSTFVADLAHRTVLADTLGGTLSQNTATESGLQFGTLYLLDGAPRTISTFGNRVIVGDSLVFGASTAGLSSGYVLARGPVFTVSGSSMAVNLLEADSTLLVGGSYAVTTTQFGGQNQAIPVLPYVNVDVLGTAFIADSLVLPVGATLNVQDGDLRVNGKLLRADQIVTNGTGILTMTDPADVVDALAFIHFFGGNESGRLTEGVLRVHGGFIQSNGTSDSSFFASGNHETRFTDSTVAVNANATSMFAGASRFNNVTITGEGVAFSGPIWVGGNVSIVSPTVQPVTGGTVTIAGSLSDAGPTAYLWNVDTTLFLSRTTVLPDSMNKTVILAGGDTLHNILRLGGELVIQDTLVVNGFTIQAHGALSVTGPGLLQMTNSTDDVTIDGTATFNSSGAPSTGFMTAGRLTLHGNFITGMVTPGVFEATGSHVTVFNGGTTQLIGFGAGSPRGAFNDVVAYNDLTMPNGLIAHGTFRDSVTTGTLNLFGNNSTLWAWHVEMTDAQLIDLPLQMGEQSQLDTVSFTFADPSAVSQIVVEGAGQAAPLDLHAITFNSWAGAPQLVRTVDTASNGLGVKVRMFGSTPFDGSSETVTFDPADPGLSSVTWSHLALSGPLPLTFDSLIPFGLSLAVTEPDGSNRAEVLGTVAISLLNGGTATLSGTTTATFDGQSASFFGLTLAGAVTGASFHFEMQGRSIDSLDTTPFDLLNPAPVGAIVFDGGALDGLWSSAANWSTDIVPTENDSIFVPGGTTVTYDVPNDTIGTLVLGAGATLNLGFGDTLVALGRVTAGNTIAGGGVLQLAGALQQVSGTLPSTVITGTALLTGQTTINGSLTIDGTGAELNVAGKRIDISNALTTQNDGVLTMDGADTVYTADAHFNGGDETGRLIDGLLVIQGSSLTQGGPVPTSFTTGGTFTVLFADGGASQNAFLNDPASSHFQNVKVQNSYGTDLSGNSADVFVLGDLMVSASGVVHGSQVHVVGNVSSTGSNDTIGINTLRFEGSIASAGGYDVINTEYTGKGQSVIQLPYQTLAVTGSDAVLGVDVTAPNVTVGDTNFALAGHTLHATWFSTQAGGRVVMTGANDTLFADSAAYFNGGNEAGHLTDGAVILSGLLDGSQGNYIASGNHLTRFVGVADTVQTSPNIVCEVCFAYPGVWFGRLEVVNASVTSLEPHGGGLHVEGNATLTNGAIGTSGSTLYVQGILSADATSSLTGYFLTIGQRMDLAAGATFDVTNTDYNGPSGHITAAPFQNLLVNGAAVLDTAVTANNVTVQLGGRLDLGGHALRVDTTFAVNDSSHLVMHDPADSLNVLGTAYFQGGDATGDLTDGLVRALHFIQQQGSTGGDNGFVQSGNGRVQPQAGDTIQMNPVGPAGSRISFLDLSAAGGTVVLGNTWVADSMVNTNPATNVDTLTSFDNVVVMGNVRWTAGTLNLDTLAVGGTLTVDSTTSTYQVALTKFVGTAQTVPADVPYTDFQVYYPATLGGDIRRAATTAVAVLNGGDLDLGGHFLDVRTFRTDGQGILTMTHAGDTLQANTVTMGGGSTAGHLTAGVIGTYEFIQNNNNNDTSYAPTGTHALWLENVGLASEVGARIQMAEGSGSYLNILHLYATGGSFFDKPKIWSDISVHDTLAVFGQLDSPGQAIDALGPVVVNSGAEFTLGTLTIHDTLAVDPGASYSVNTTLFAPGAEPIPVVPGYINVSIEGDQTLINPLTVSGNVHVMMGGVLTLNGRKVTANGALVVQDSARLVMANAADTVETGVAVFDGRATGGDLSAGRIRVASAFQQFNSHSDSSFAPTGTAVEFFGGAYRTADFATPGSGRSHFRDVDIVDAGTALAFNTPTAVTGTVTVNDNAQLVTGGDAANVDFYGPVIATTLGAIGNGYQSTLTFHNTLSVAQQGNYNVINTAFAGVNDVPNLQYQNLTLLDGVHDTLTHGLQISGILSLQASTSGAQDLVLHNHTISTWRLDVLGLGRFTMKNSGDTLNVSGDANFDGANMTNRLLAGQIQFGGNVFQNATNSQKSLRADGTRLRFDGGGDATQYVSFATPGLTNSYLGNVFVADGGTLVANSSMVIQGGLELEFGTYFFVNAPSATIDIFGGTILGDGASVYATDPSQFVDLYGSVTRTGFAPTWTVVNTRFAQSTTLPDLSYTNLYLGDGTHDTLTSDISVAGLLSLTSSTANGQDLVLGGHAVHADQLQVSGNARLTMDDPADLLYLNTDASFDGADLSGRLTQGTLSIGGGLIQAATTSDKSFRADGTTTEFRYFGSQHLLTFASPDSSYLGNVRPDAGNNLPLASLTGFTAKGNIDGGLGLGLSSNGVVAADTIFLGSLPGFTAITVPYLRARQLVGTFTPFIYSVATTELGGNGNILDLAYDTLIVAGQGSLVSNNATANWVKVFGQLDVASGTTLHATKVLTVAGATAQLRTSGGTVNVDSLFATVSGGTLRADSGGVNTHDASFGGGATTGLLTGGALNVTGNFEQVGSGSFSFDADSTFTVAINGGGQHAIAIADPANTRFGTLLLEGSTFGTDTTTFPAATITAYRLATNNAPVIIGTAGGSQIDMATLDVHGLADSGVRIAQSSTTGQPLTFDDVTFRGFTAADVQLSITHPGTGILDPTQFFNVDFDNAAAPNGTSGFFVRATDSDGIGTFLNLQIYGPDSGVGALLTSLISGALVGWFPPT